MGFNNFYYVKEAFQEKDMSRVSTLIKSFLERKLGIKFYQMPGPDYFKNSKSSGVGIRYLLSDGRSIRFNFINNEIIGVDIWKTLEKDPYVEIDTHGISVTKILPFILDEIQNPKMGKFDVDLTDNTEKENMRVEANQVKIGDIVYPTQKKAIEAMLTVGKSTKEIIQLTGAKASSVSVVKKEMGMMVEVKVFEAGKEEVNNDPTLPAIQKRFDSIEYADPEFVFEDLNSLVEMIAEGHIYSLLITGLPGTGKTYTTTTVLDRYGSEDKFYKHFKGVASPMGLYRILFENNGKVIVFDDCDKVLEDDDSVSILKSALDNKENRSISWSSRLTYNPEGMPEEQIDALTNDGKLPNKFIFTGRVIFITNLYQNKIDSAVRSRSISIDVSLRRQDIIVRIRQIMNDIQPDMDKKYKEELLEYMETNIDKMKSDIDIRTFDKALRVVASGKPNWQRLVSLYV